MGYTGYMSITPTWMPRPEKPGSLWDISASHISPHLLCSCYAEAAFDLVASWSRGECLTEADAAAYAAAAFDL